MAKDEKIVKNVDEIDPFGMEAGDNKVFETPSNENGFVKNPNVYKPTFKKDEKKRKSVIRFVANVDLGGKLGKSRIEVAEHFIAKGGKATGQHQCKRFNKESKVFCELCDAFSKYSKIDSLDAAKKAISRAENFYSLIQVIEDENEPELVGKIMILKYGKKINDKLVELEEDKKINPFNMKKSKNFDYVMKRDDVKTTRDVDYASCTFDGGLEPIKVYKDGKWVDVFDADGGFKKGKDGTDKGAKKLLIEYINSCPQKLSDFELKDWSNDEEENITDFIDDLLNVNDKSAKKSIQNSSSKSNPAAGSEFESDDELDTFTPTSKNDKNNKSKSEDIVKDADEDDDDLPF